MSDPTTCGLCGRPTRDHAGICDHDLDQLTTDLRDLADWLAEELDNAATGQKATRYRHDSGAKSSDVADLGLRMDWQAVNTRTRVRAALVACARWCAFAHVRHSSPHVGGPAEADSAALAQWLLWRVDGMALTEGGARHASRIMAAVFSARRVIDCPPEREWLGSCLDCGRGRLFATRGAELATCDMCRTTFEADEVRAWLLAQLDDKLMTAAEIAKVSTYLGLRADRERVRKRLNTWAKRGTIVAEPSLTEEVTYRFGPIWRRLVAEDAVGTSAEVS